jgi:hypothetical protein
MKYKTVSITDAVVRSGGGGLGRFVIILVLLSIIGGALVVMMTQAHARRHSEHVQNIPDKCNKGHYEVHMFRPSDNRDAYLCFVEGYFVISIFNFTQEMIEKWGDSEVTAFSRPSAKTMQDVIDYMVSKGYQVVP